MFKKTAIAALVLGSGAASAAMYAPAPAPACAAGNVTVPCERNAWDLGVDALYLRSEDNQGSGANANPYHAKYGWGFRLEGSYHFGTGNDATVNWAHFNKKSDNVARGLYLRSKFDVVNVEFGQAVDFGENVDVRFQGGVQWLTVHDQSYTAAGVLQNVDGKYSAFGPRVGATAKYDFGNGFAAYVGGNSALVTGKMEMRTGSNTSAYGTALSSDMGLGVAYTHSMAQGDLTARLGWNVMRVDHTRIGASQAWSGMNLGLKWVGNA